MANCVPSVLSVRLESLGRAMGNRDSTVGYPLKRFEAGRATKPMGNVNCWSDTPDRPSFEDEPPEQR